MYGCVPVRCVETTLDDPNFQGKESTEPFSYHPCMVYLPTFTRSYHSKQPNVGKYTIHGWYGIGFFGCQAETKTGGLADPARQALRFSTGSDPDRCNPWDFLVVENRDISK